MLFYEVRVFKKSTGKHEIKKAASILINKQLEKTDIIRTDGNEFLIYLVGFTQKQVTNYIHKLNISPLYHNVS